MGNVLDYIKWRGDLELKASPFNYLDNMILSEIAYVEMDDIFANSKEKELPLSQVYSEYVSKVEPHKIYRSNSILREAPNVLRAAALSVRFRDVIVRNYVNIIDVEKTVQFAAMEFVLPDETSYIAFRGTDDTIIGWKEDFMLAVAEVQSEKEAVNYVNKIAINTGNWLRLGGHSKGGHLAVYAAVRCEEIIQKTIINIYSNDGPGFTKQFVDAYAESETAKKVIKIVPEDSIVGMLMEPMGKVIVVKSSIKGIMQHDMLTWILDGPALDKVNEVSSLSKALDKAISGWLDDFEEEKRPIFIEELFSVFTATNAETLTELQEAGLKGFQEMLKQSTMVSADTRDKISQVLKNIFSEMISEMKNQKK